MIKSTIIDTVAIYSLITYSPKAHVLFLTLGLWLVGDLGFKMGYYRLWYQKSYECHYVIRVILALFGAFTSKGSIKEWLICNGKKEIEIVDPIVKWQDKYYSLISMTALGFPVIVGYLLNDFLGGLLYGIFVSRFLDSYFWTWTHFILNWGKEYPQMNHSGHYTDGGWIFDLDKWAIRCAISFGLAKENYKGLTQTKVLKQEIASSNLKAKNSCAEQELDKIIPFNPKKAYTMDEFNQLVKDHPQKNFAIISKQILDITGFDKEHPGGARYINVIKGIDGTHEFYGSLHGHSNDAKDWARSKKFADLIPAASKAG